MKTALTIQIHMCLDIRHYKANRKYLQSYSNVVTFIFIVLHYVYVLVSTYVKPTKLIHQKEQFLRNIQTLSSSRNVAFLRNANIRWSSLLSANDTCQWQTSPSNLCILNVSAEAAATFNAFIRKVARWEPRSFWLSFMWFSPVSIKKFSK